MNFLKTLLAGAAGTTGMTLFSYGMSYLRKKEFKEPILLHKLVNRALPPGLIKKSETDTTVDGWLLHYLTGMVFTNFYNRIWQQTKTAPTLASGVVFGAVSGLVGALIWNTVFKIHPDPPKVDIKEFYTQLMSAHIIFGILAALGYRFPEQIESPGTEDESSGAVSEA